ncbi:MAG: DUF962 domain-containing protein [Halobacteriales archaeon]|nr:DUF962 domain-containing protein [Halobacteriales archaeon]
MAERYHRDFASFWYYYVSQHMRRGTRAMHYAGTWLALLAIAAAVGTGTWWLAPLGVATTYLFAWVSHWAIEKNRPASFVYPGYSFLGDLVLFGRITTGHIGKDVEVVAERLAGGWAVDRSGFYPPEHARAHGISTDRNLVSHAAAR